MRCGRRSGKLIAGSPRLLMAGRLSQLFKMPLASLVNEMSEAEFQLHAALVRGEASDGDRLDYWLGGLLASFLNVHRRSGSPSVNVKDLRPAWGFAERAAKRAEENESTATAMLIAWAKGASQ